MAQSAQDISTLAQHLPQLGSASYDIAHLAAGLVLLFSFGLLYQRRLHGLIGIYAGQSALVAVAAAWQAFALDTPHLYVTASIAFTLKTLLIPWGLYRMEHLFALEKATETKLGAGTVLFLGVGLVTLAILLVSPVTASGSALTRELLVVALSVVLLALLSMILRVNPISKVISFMTLENGLMLGAVGVKGMPLAVELSTAALVAVAFALFFYFFSRIYDRFGSLDLDRVEAARGDQP